MKKFCYRDNLTCNNTGCSEKSNECGLGLALINEKEGVTFGGYYPWELSQFEITMLFKHCDEFMLLLEYKKQAILNTQW